MMDRNLAFLSDDLLSDLLSCVLRIAQEKQCGFRPPVDWVWTGPHLPGVCWEVLAEYKIRNRRSP